MNCEKVTQQCIKFIQDKVKESGTKGIVLGISGGIDSSVVAALCIRAVGKDNCTFISIPVKNTEISEQTYQLALARTLQFSFSSISLESILSAFIASGMKEGLFGKMAWANLQARLRMVIQYYYANLENKLVVGTTNKTEENIGYFTKYGDGGVDIEPICDLYKTEVWELGKYLGIPKEIIERAPTAGLWEGQTDEGEIGMTYKELDAILQSIESGSPLPNYPDLHKRILNSEHKRHMPPSPKLKKE